MLWFPPQRFACRLRAPHLSLFFGAQNQQDSQDRPLFEHHSRSQDSSHEPRLVGLNMSKALSLELQAHLFM